MGTFKQITENGQKSTGRCPVDLIGSSWKTVGYATIQYGTDTVDG